MRSQLFIFLIILFSLLSACSQPGAWDLLARSSTLNSDFQDVRDDPVVSETTSQTPEDQLRALWGSRIKLTVDHSFSAETLVGFPLLVKLNPGRISYGRIKADASDIAFYSYDLTSEYAYEIDGTWNPGGESLIWVKIPSLPAGGTTDLWMYYTSATETGFMSPADVWDNSYVSVMHLNPPGGEYIDSTGIHHGLDNPGFNPSNTAGYLGSAVSFIAGIKYIEIPATAALDDLGPVTYSGWYKNTATMGDHLFSKGSMRVLGDSATDRIRFEKTRTMGIMNYDENTGLLTPDTWVNIAISWPGGDEILSTMNYYVNGILYAGGVSGTDAAGLVSSDAGSNLFLGGNDSGGQSLVHALDEFRISNTVRSAEWIRMQYLSQTDALISIYGSEEILQ